MMERIEAAYRRREIEYPVEYAIDMTVGVAGTDNVYALTALVEWVNRKYEAGLGVEDFRNKKIPEIQQRLVELSESWLGGEQPGERFVRRWAIRRRPRRRSRTPPLGSTRN